MVLLRILGLSVFSCKQNVNTRTVLNEEYARKAVKEILSTKDDKPSYDTLIKDKETAIAVVEPVLFSIYGKSDIINERPYECYLIDGYWYISGTLPENSVGGTFEVIVDSKNGSVLKLIHGK